MRRLLPFRKSKPENTAATPETKQSPLQTLVLAGAPLSRWSFSSTASQANYSRYFTDASKASHAVYSVTTGIADAIAEIMDYAELLDEENNVISDHWTVELLNHPNDDDTRTEFVQQLMLGLLLTGNAYAYGLETALRIGGKRFESMHVLPSESVTIKSGGLLEKVSGYNLAGDPLNGSRGPELTKENVLFLRKPNPAGNTPYGVSPLIAVEKQLEILDNGLRRQNTAIKQGSVDTLIAPPSTSDTLPPTQQQKDMLENMVNEQNENGQKYTKAIGYPIAVHKLGDPLEELNIQPTEEAAVLAICNAYNYPIDLLRGQSTYSNISEAKKTRFVIARPYAAAFLEKYTQWTGVAANGLKWKLNTDKIDELYSDPNEILGAMEKAGTTINERRDFMGLAPVEEKFADEVTYSAGLMFGREDFTFAYEEVAREPERAEE